MGNIQSFCPTYRINHRDKNLEFFCGRLGMKVLLEEGAMVYLGGKAKKSRLILEESPGIMSYHGVTGTKRHELTSLEVSPEDFKSLVNRNELPAAEIKSLSDNKVGFFLTSPEDDRFCILTQLSISEISNIRPAEISDLEEVSDFSLASVKLNVKNAQAAADFENALKIAFESDEKIAFTVEAEVVSGAIQDLEARGTWDFESFEIRVSKDFDLAGLAEKYRREIENIELYMDKAEKVLSVKLSMGVELWFEK